MATQKDFTIEQLFIIEQLSLINKKECTNCGAVTNKTAIRLMVDGEQWWHFSSYKTKAGNVYSGLFCPDCSDSVYIENKQVTADQ